MGLIRDDQGKYTTISAVAETDILAAAEDILRRRFTRLTTLGAPSVTSDFLRMRLAGLLHEEFHAVWLDQRHSVIAVERLFNGTINGSSVYPREVVRAALRHNAAAVVFAHNHPSGQTEASQADREITRQLQQALNLIEVRVLDHFVVGADSALSFAERGWL